MTAQLPALYLCPISHGLPLAVVLALRAGQAVGVLLALVFALGGAGWHHLLNAVGLALAVELALAARRSRFERRDD